MSRVQLTTLVFLTTAVWSGLLIVDGVAVSLGWFRWVSLVVAAILMLLVAFDLWLWRWSLLRGWFVHRPDIQGTWKATLHSSYAHGGAGSPATVEGYMTVRQTYSTLSLCLMTEESESRLIGGELLRAPDGTFSAAAVYQNLPRDSVRHRSQIHHGAFILQVCGVPPQALSGSYWTDRETKGEILLRDRCTRIATSFADAKTREADQ